MIFGYSYAQELPKKEQSKPTQTEQNPATYNRGTKDLPITIEIAPSAPLKIETDRDKEAENEKARNEWLTAQGTAAIAVFTFVLACATIGLAVFTYSLWGETGKLVIGANETAKRQLRAYVSATPTIMNGPTNLMQQFSMINHGQTPAYNVIETGLMDIFPYPLPPKFNFPAIPDQRHSRVVLHPHATNYTGRAPAVRTFTKQEIAQITTGDEYRLYIYGVITYTNVFKNPHVTKFCHSIPGNAKLALFFNGSLVQGNSFFTEAANQHDETD